MNWVRIIFYISILVIQGYLYYMYRRDKKDCSDRLSQERLIYNYIVTASLFLWLVLWDLVVGFTNTVRHPFTLIPYFWVPLISLLQLAFIQGISPMKDSPISSNFIEERAGIAVSASFAVGSVLIAMGFKQKEGVRSAGDLVLLGLLVAVMTLVPSIYAPRDTEFGLTVRAIQHVSLQWVSALLMSGIIYGISLGTTSK